MLRCPERSYLSRYIFSPVPVCAGRICACNKRLRTFKEWQKGPDTMLSDRKRKFNFGRMYRVISYKKKKKKGGDLSLHSLSSPSFSSCHSCWQSLIVLDKLMKSNTEEATGSLHLPECMSVCTYLPVPMSGRLVSSGVPASQSTRWWDSKRVMRSLSIPPGRGPFCRREVVININYSHIYAVRKLRGENA